MRGLGLRLIATFVFVMLFVGFGHAQESAKEMHSRIDNGGPIARGSHGSRTRNLTRDDWLLRVSLSALLRLARLEDTR